MDHSPGNSRNDLVRLLHDHCVEAQRLGQVFAEQNGMHPTDLNALLAVIRAEKPLTPGRLGEHLGLSSGATTALLDRLARAGHVTREPDPRDRRRVIVRLCGPAAVIAAAFFGPLGVTMDGMLAGYDAVEIYTVRRFLAEMNKTMRAHRRAVAELPT